MRTSFRGKKTKGGTMEGGNQMTTEDMMKRVMKELETTMRAMTGVTIKVPVMETAIIQATITISVI